MLSGLSLYYAKTPPIYKLKWLIYLLFTSILLIVALVGWHQLRSAHDERIGQAKVSVSNLTSAIEAHAKDAIGQADTVLFGIVERTKWETIRGIDIVRMKRLFKSQVLAHPLIQGIFIYDDNGDWVVTGKDTIPYKANNRDREYFKYYEQFSGSDYHVGKVIVSRSTGQLVIPVSRRINYQDGSFAGVALITLRVDYFVQYFNRFNLGENGTISLVYSDGVVLVRRPFAHDIVGTSIINGTVFKILLPQSPSGTSVFASAVDQVVRVYSYSSFYKLPLVAIAGVDLETVLAPWWAQVRFYLLISFLILLGLTGFVFLFLRQLDKSAQFEAALEKLSNEDALTGLANRRRLNDGIRIEVSRATRVNMPLSILMLDIDYFKKYNDEYGHVAGDECIRAVAGVVASASRREEDIAARYGGEEMALLLPGCDEKSAFELAELIRSGVFQLRISHTGNPTTFVTVSVGYYSYLPAPNARLDELSLLKNADAALYKAKNRGRNNVFPPSG